MMQRRGIQLSNFLILLIGIFFPAQIWALSFEKLAPGLEYSIYQPAAQGAKLYIFKLDLKKVQVKPILAQDFKKTSMSIKNMVERSGALGGINANFFDQNRKPLGLILRDGKVLKGPHPTRWWASLLIQGNQAHIEKALKKNQFQKYKTGIQAGPRLVISGKPVRLKENFSPKSAVGIDKHGHLYLMVSEGGFEINELAKWLAKSPARGGLELQDALNLDGGSSSQFYIKVKGLELSVPGLVEVPVGLGIFKKS